MDLIRYRREEGIEAVSRHFQGVETHLGSSIYPEEDIKDAYNVLHVTGILPPEIAGPDLPALARLVARSRYTDRACWLVCDGAPPGARSDGTRSNVPLAMLASSAVYIAPVIVTTAGASPRAAVHQVEWRKIMAGDPVEINPSFGHGMKVMTVEEWSRHWKRNDDLKSCLACGSLNTKEHHFIQTWCRGKKKFESETLCLDCHYFSWRSYCDPDFKTPEEYEKAKWEGFIRSEQTAAA